MVREQLDYLSYKQTSKIEGEMVGTSMGVLHKYTTKIKKDTMTIEITTERKEPFTDNLGQQPLVMRDGKTRFLFDAELEVSFKTHIEDDSDEAIYRHITQSHETRWKLTEIDENGNPTPNQPGQNHRRWAICDMDKIVDEILI